MRSFSLGMKMVAHLLKEQWGWDWNGKSKGRAGGTERELKLWVLTCDCPLAGGFCRHGLFWVSQSRTDDRMLFNAHFQDENNWRRCLNGNTVQQDVAVEEGVGGAVSPNHSEMMMFQPLPLKEGKPGLHQIWLFCVWSFSHFILKLQLFSFQQTRHKIHKQRRNKNHFWSGWTSRRTRCLSHIWPCSSFYYTVCCFVCLFCFVFICSWMFLFLKLQIN